jgi:hypothetical protein
MARRRAIGGAVFGLNEIWGTLALGLSIIAIVTFGTSRSSGCSPRLYLLYAVRAVRRPGVQPLRQRNQDCLCQRERSWKLAAGGTVCRL